MTQPRRGIYIVYWNSICCVIVSREVAATTPRSWNGKGEVLGVVPLLRADGSEEESQVGLVLPEDVRPSEAETTTSRYIVGYRAHHRGAEPREGGGPWGSSRLRL